LPSHAAALCSIHCVPSTVDAESLSWSPTGRSRPLPPRLEACQPAGDHSADSFDPLVADGEPSTDNRDLFAGSGAAFAGAGETFADIGGASTDSGGILEDSGKAVADR